MQSPYRDSNTDLQDYFENGVPPPHRMSSYGAPLGSPRMSSYSTQDSIGLESRSLTHSYSQTNLHESSIPPVDRDYSTPKSAWAEKQDKASKRSKYFVVIGILVLLLIVIGGIVAGVVVAQIHKKSSRLASSENAASTVNQTDVNDPSTFVLDPRLKKSFWGIAYTPEKSQMPWCGNKLSQVINDIQLLSQLTTRIRLYGGDCNQSALVLEAIKQTKVDMTVYLGNFVVADDAGAAYMRQRDVIKTTLETYGTDHIGGVTVGNEFMLNYVTALKSEDANTAAANVGAAILVANIDDTKKMLAGMSLSKTLEVGNSDAGSYFSDLVLADVNYGMANVHPWFASVSVDNSAAWTNEFFQNNNIAQSKKLPNTPTMYIAETGWPTKSSDKEHSTNTASDASVPNLQIFLDTFICQANTNGTGYFFFSYQDEPWKDLQFGGVEGWWGLFDKDRQLKDLKMPDCAISK